MDKLLYFSVIVFSATCTSSLYAEGQNRILNGSPANENQFSYMISLQRLSQIDSVTRGHRCGGALVTLQHAVTAASCTLEFVSRQTNDVDWVLHPINPAEYRVFAGSVALTNDTSADRIRRIANITIHPKYNMSFPVPNNRFPNDIAVIILGTPFLTNTVAQLSVTDLSSYAEPVSCILSGWGAQGSSPTTSTQLMYSKMLTIDQNVCALMANSPLLPTMLCAWAPGAGIIEGAAGCSGDEGNPLVCHSSLAGLLIQTSDCSQVPRRPQLFTRVSSYTSWLNTVIIAQPIPDLGPETSTEASLTTSPVTSPATTPTTSAPGGAPSFQAGMAVLAVMAIAPIL